MFKILKNRIKSLRKQSRTSKDARGIMPKYHQYDMLSYDAEEALRLANETQQRLDRIIEYNEELYKRSKILASRSRQNRAKLYDRE
jgi:hypothetical protein